jgi:hypothetical protein
VDDDDDDEEEVDELSDPPEWSDNDNWLSQNWIGYLDMFFCKYFVGDDGIDEIHAKIYMYFWHVIVCTYLNLYFVNRLHLEVLL